MTLINILFQTCLVTNSLVQTNVELPSNLWTGFVDGFVNNDKKSSFINSYLIQDLECKNLLHFMTKMDKYNTLSTTKMA